MVRLADIYFRLGFHISPFRVDRSSKMFYYLWFKRSIYNIFNPRIAILLIRRVSLFMLMSNRLNCNILPIINGFGMYKREWESVQMNFHEGYASESFMEDIHSHGMISNNKGWLARFLCKLRRAKMFKNENVSSKRRKKLHTDYVSLMKSLKRYLKSVNFRKYSFYMRKAILSHYKFRLRNRYQLLLKKKNTQSLYQSVEEHMTENNEVERSQAIQRIKDVFKFRDCDFVWLMNNYISRFFYKYRMPILLNIVNLLSNWHTYYEYVRTIVVPISGFGYRHGKYAIGFIRRNKKFTLYRGLKSNNLFNGIRRGINPCAELALRIYYKLSVFLDLTVLDWESNPNLNNKSFRKFFVLLRVFWYLRWFKILPNILFYLESSTAELARVAKFRICIIALVDSDCSSVRDIAYPIPCNFGNYLSKIFYSYLIINSFFLGRILLLLDTVY